MRTPSGDLHVVDFKTNQIVSDIQPKDYWDDKRHWEIKNNIDTLEFRVFENTDHATILVQQNLVLKEVRGGRIVPYVITETEKDSKDRSLMVYASGEWIQLAKAGIIEPQKIESKTLKQCMEIALKGTKWAIGKTEHDGAHSMVIEEFTDPLDLLKKIAASFEIEIQYRAEVVGSKIVGRYVDMVQKRGRDTRKEVTFGKDLIGIKRIENSQNICTALLGFVKKEDGEFITISSINKGVPYLVDDAAYQRWNESGKHKFAFYTPQTDDQNMSPDRLLTLMKTEMSKIVNASVSYGVDAQNIARIPGLSHEEINEGDTIRIIDEGFTPKLYLEARAIAGDESFKDPTQDNYVFGDYREIVDQNDELRRLYQKILSSLYDKVPQELFDQLNNKVKEQNKDIIDAKDKADKAQQESQAAKDLAEATQDYMDQNMVDVITQPTPPTNNLKEGKSIWIDNSDPNNKVQKIWKDGTWQRITPDIAPLQQDILTTKQQLATAQTDINTAKQDITNNKTNLQNQINTANQDITAIKTDVLKKVDKTWIDSQLQDKADKSGVYTKDYIDTNLVGKSIYETDKQGNITKFTNLETKQTQTETSLTSKAEKSELTTLSNNLTGVSNKVNTVEQTAESNKQRITSAEGTLNTVTGDVTNLKTKTNEIKQTVDENTATISKVTNTVTGGNDNLLKNARLEDMSNWTSQVGVAIDNTVLCNGYNSMRSIQTGLAVDSYRGLQQQNVPFVIGGNFVWSVYVYTDDVSTLDMGVRLEVICEKDDNTRTKTYNITTTGETNITLPGNGVWTRYIIIADNIPTLTTKVRISARVVRNGRAWFSNPQWERGLLVTAFKPSSLETTSTIQTSSIKQTVDTISTNLTSVTSKADQLELKTNTLQTTVEGHTNQITNVTNKANQTEIKTNTLETTVNGQAQTITNITNRTGTLETKTNQLRNDTDSNTATLTQVTQSIVGGNENYIIDSTCNNVYPVLYDDPYQNINKVTSAFDTDAIMLTCTDYTDAYYQIGAIGMTAMHGFKAGDTLTLSLDLKQDIAGLQTVIFQHNGTAWTETEFKSHTNLAWARVNHTFTLATTTKGWYTRFRFPRIAGANTKKLWFKNVKLEYGSIATPWSINNREITKKTNEIKQTVDTNSQTISKVQQDQGTMQSTLNQVKQTTDLNSQTITTLSQTQGQQGTTIQQNTSDITQLNNQISSKVSDTQMQDYVGGLGRVNELLNSTFEDKTLDANGNILTRTPSLSKWGTSGLGANTTAVPESARHHDGCNSVKIYSTGQTANIWASIGQNVSATSGSGNYIFGVWLYTDNLTALDQGALVEMKFMNGTTTVANKVTEAKPLMTANQWTFVTVSMAVPDAPVTVVNCAVRVRRNGTIWVSQPQYQGGTTPSTFMPNPKDIANYDQLVGEIAKKVTTTDFNNKISTMQTTIDQQSNSINLKAEKNDVYNKIDADGRFGSKAIVDTHTSTLSVMSNEINLRVKSGDVASTINQTAQSVLIQADKIYLNGFIEAKHLKAQELVGVTIKTAPNGQQRYVKLNQQNIELYDKDTVRAEFRFFNRSDGTAINPTLTLGRSVSGGIVGALNLTQWTPINAQGVDNYQNSQATIGMVEQYNSTSNEFTYGSKINFFKNGQMDIKTNHNLTLSASQQGHIQIATDTVAQNKSIFIEPSLNLEVTAGNSIWLSANGGSFNADVSTNHTFKNGSGNFYFENKTKTKGNQTLLQDDNNNADLRLAYIRIRASHVEGYQSSLQLIPAGESAPTAGLQAGNISYTSLTNRSSRTIKSNIRNLEINSLDKIMGLKVQQYNFKSDVEKLYKMREDTVGTNQLFTTADIPMQYGIILEDTDTTFHADNGEGINLYTLVSLNVDATQKIKITQNVHEEEIAFLKSQVVSQEDRIARLEGLLLQQLINKKPEQP
ncbi:phage tail spike protein [Bacillus mycoides]|uniref:phage tail spike protein n=1 Tax=Bacillus mycoides TaxID=1405 RepID=UPI002E1ADDB8|nr:phage tail spike protein [Bacillus mycoides]MED1287297.1 phage tail spike protein [Bacillus mycoides]